MGDNCLVLFKVFRCMWENIVLYIILFILLCFLIDCCCGLFEVYYLECKEGKRFVCVNMFNFYLLLILIFEFINDFFDSIDILRNEIILLMYYFGF